MGSAEAWRGNAVIRLLTDENLDGRIVRGVEMHHPEIDLLRVQETDAFERRGFVSAGVILLTPPSLQFAAHPLKQIAPILRSKY